MKFSENLPHNKPFERPWNTANVRNILVRTRIRASKEHPPDCFPSTSNSFARFPHQLIITVGLSKANSMDHKDRQVPVEQARQNNVLYAEKELPRWGLEPDGFLQWSSPG